MNCAAIIFLLSVTVVAVATPARADPPACPKEMPATVEAKLLPVLEATKVALDRNDWSDKSYENALDKLLLGKDDASIEARVALMDYPIAAAYSEQISCAVSTGGKKALKFLKLYSRCDIAPSHSPIPRDHTRPLRSITLQAWHAGHGKGSCESER